MNEGLESSISTLVHQNAAAMQELKLDFELAKYQFLVTSERVEAGMNNVKERLKLMLIHQQRITVKEHLDVCVTAACSSFSLHRIHRLYRVLLTLISLEHIILTENHFSIQDTWLPLVTGVGEMLAIQDMSSTRKNSSIIETERDEGDICDRVQGDMNPKPESLTGAQSTFGAVDKNELFKANAGRAAISGHDGNVGPPPQYDLPPLPPPVMNSDWGDLHVSGAVSHPRISVEALSSTPHGLSDIMADMTPENTLDIIEADLGHFAPSPSFTATVMLPPPLSSPLLVTPPLSLSFAQDCSPCAGRTPSISQDYLVDTSIDLIEAELKSSTTSDNCSVFKSSPLLLLYTPPSLLASFSDFDPSMTSISSASCLGLAVNLPSEHSRFFEEHNPLVDPELSANWNDFGYTPSPANGLSTSSFAPATTPIVPGVSSPRKRHPNILTSRILRSFFSSFTPSLKRYIKHSQFPSFFVSRSVVNCFKTSGLRKGRYRNQRRTLMPTSTIIGGRVKVRKIQVLTAWILTED
ncbi:uncharacterized protein C8R40DRAFT_1072409 [Lentinula edodes]|uniref:uncharacterized protein n=1 Tax=Lentinula edodes TaxID=5353 RepID=UPI001E8E8126|nr:uncharacterized protein C8R40DRAFT_1072409 [Lentinula edodes]KAH7871665.1 hypothetical protein C8R40DRAFT_1072409 [Lentinula edodes]